jgi:YD repeat-containing protein
VQNSKVCSVNCFNDPINPTTGGVYSTVTDIQFAAAGALGFRRFYNSQLQSRSELGFGWRPSYSQRIKIITTPPVSQYLAASGTSQLYSTPATACTSGFSDIQATVSAWAGATASYDSGSGVCILNKGGQTIGTLVVQGTAPMSPHTSPFEYQAVREDGSILRYSAQGGFPNNQPGNGLQLAITASGFTLIDEQDNVETYDASGVLQSITSRSGVVQTVTHDSNGRLQQVSDTFGHSLTIAHDAQGNLSSVSAVGGGTVQYAYDGTPKLTGVIHLDGTTTSFSYGNGWQMTGLTDESGSAYSSWTYDAQGRAIATQLSGGANSGTLVYNSDGSVVTTDALRSARTFTHSRVGDSDRVVSISGSHCAGCEDMAATTYDVAGWVSSRTDYNGNLTCYSNEAARGLELVRVEGFAPGTTCPANLASYTPATGTRQRKITTTWDSTFREPATITEARRTTTFAYYPTGDLHTQTITDTTVTPHVARTWTYTYNSYGRVLTADGPRTDVSDVTTYTYYDCATGNECGQVHTITNPANQTTTYNTYNVYGQPLTITDSNGTLTTLTYDARQRLKSRQTAGETTAFDYWPTGLLKKVTLPDASFVAYTYDGAHRLTQITDALGNKTVYTLDAMGNRTAENSYDPANALHRTHTRVFNTLNQLWQDVNAAGTAAVTTTFGYDAQGNQKTIAAPLARNTTNDYDELNRLKQITDPANGITQFGYDANDNLTSVNDPRGLATGYSYNGFGELNIQTSPDTGTMANTYDSAGNLATSTDARGAISTYTYDTLNRVTSVAYSRSGTTDQTLSFTYDTGTNGKGHLTGTSDANHSLSWSYDALGRITGKSQTIGSVTKSIGYAYTNGNLTTLTTPSGQTVTHGYNGNHQVTSVAVNGTTVLNSVTYEPLGPVSGWTWGNGTTTTRTYDTDGKISQIVSAGTKTYSYDDAFRITGLTDTSPGASNWTYGYDNLDRLISGTSPSVTRGWTYDPNGNRLTETGTAASTYSISPSSNRIASITGALARTYAYDAAGNTTGYSTVTASYNNAGRLQRPRPTNSDQRRRERHRPLRL